jgi:molybdate transport system substrate-binding protein
MPFSRRRVTSACLGLMLLGWSIPCVATETLIVFAPASLKNALDGANEQWTSAGNKKVSISYAASSALARQIEQGAPADIIISADLDWMKYLEDRSLVKSDTIVQLLGNEIVLIAPKDSNKRTTIAKDFALKEMLGDGRLAMADVKAVPAGKYGKAALESLGVWSSVQSNVAQAENVRAALKLVSTGEATLGIVYKTDAIAESAVEILGTFPASSHPPVIYPIAVTVASQHPDAASLIRFLQTTEARAIFEKQGFTVLVPPVTN